MDRNFSIEYFGTLLNWSLIGVENTFIYRCLGRTLDSSNTNVLDNCYLENYINLSHPKKSLIIIQRTYWKYNLHLLHILEITNYLFNTPS